MTKTVFLALREYEEFFVLFQRETLNTSLSNQPVVIEINNRTLFANFASFLLIPPEVFWKISFAYFTGKQLCWSLFLIKLQSLIWDFTRKEALAQVFSCDFFELFKSTFLQTTSGGDSFCFSFHFISLTLFSLGLTTSYSKITNKYQLKQKI